MSLRDINLIAPYGGYRGVLGSEVATRPQPYSPFGAIEGTYGSPLEEGS